MPTRYLAERLCCDPSNVTAFVDRLVESGLIQRGEDPDDRRVKTLTMTDQGRLVRGEMARVIATHPPSLVALTTDEQATLLDLLNKAWAACQRHDRTARRRPPRGAPAGAAPAARPRDREHRDQREPEEPA